MSLDEMLAGLGEPEPAAAGRESPEEVTSPPPRRGCPAAAAETPQPKLAPFGRLAPGSPSGAVPLSPSPLALSSPFAAWGGRAFDAEPLSLAAPARGRGLMDDIAQLATPAAGAGSAAGAVAFKPSPEAPALAPAPKPPASFADALAAAASAAAAAENDENDANWLVSPVRPPRRGAAPAVLQTPVKEGLAPAPAPLQTMPSLSSWMVPATKPPKPEPQQLPAGVVDEVLASLSFNPAKPRKVGGCLLRGVTHAQGGWDGGRGAPSG